MTANEMSLTEWIATESERRGRRGREENPDARAQLRPLDDFSDEYADPAEYRTVDQAQVGPKSAVLQGLIDGDCCGWGRPPTSQEFYDAMRADKPSARQKSLAGVLLRANFWELIGRLDGGGLHVAATGPRNRRAALAGAAEATRNQQERDVEKLTLPEPTASLWKRTRDTVHELGRIPDFPVTRSHPPASWPSAANRFHLPDL